MSVRLTFLHVLSEAGQEDFVSMLHTLVSEGHGGGGEGLLTGSGLLLGLFELLGVGLDRTNDLRGEL